MAWPEGVVVAGGRRGWSEVAPAWRQRTTSQPTAPATARIALATTRVTAAATRRKPGWSSPALRSGVEGPARLASLLAEEPAGLDGGWLRPPARARRAARRATTAYSAVVRARRAGPAARWMLSRTTTTAARAMVSRPRVDRLGPGWSWPRMKPARATVGHHQRATDPAIRTGSEPSSASGFQPSRWG